MARHGYAKFIREQLQSGRGESQIVAAVTNRWPSFSTKKARHYVRYYANERSRLELDARVREVNARQLARCERCRSASAEPGRRWCYPCGRVVEADRQNRLNAPLDTRVERFQRVVNSAEAERGDNARAAPANASLERAVATIQAPAPARTVVSNQLTGSVNDERPDRFSLIEIE